VGEDVSLKLKLQLTTYEASLTASASVYNHRKLDKEVTTPAVPDLPNGSHRIYNRGNEVYEQALPHNQERKTTFLQVDK
jgi:hypothetical protein